MAETEVEYGASRLGGVAAAPLLGGETPANLDAGREVRFECRDRQADESDEVGLSGEFDRPEPETTLGEVVADPGRGRVALGAVERLGKNSMTLGSAFMAAKTERSSSRQRAQEQTGRCDRRWDPR